MNERIEDFGGEGIPVLFAHANGYPPASYRRFLQRLTTVCRVFAVRHRPLWGAPEPPAGRLRWSTFAGDLLEALEGTGLERPWLLGHSMGGTIGLLAARQAPERFRGLLLLDPVFLPARFVLASSLAPRRRLERMPMIRRTLARPQHFTDRDEAFAFYRGKRAFSAFDDEALADYVAASCRPAAAGGVELAFPAAWEAAIYASAPLVWPQLAGLRLPTLGLRGEHSDTLTAAMFLRWGRLQRRAELHRSPGGHLFPLEHPAPAAQRVLDYLSRVKV
ncbi:alpha/beta fold hydrolase [Pseudohaliea rubra]|uniref:Alpha/beta hydrolase fold protein n=1 Tax=Pseudohaliea rubra DSM 19751 TaxID=1265313 RepID=A0A095WW67_9GAMM|nr:alpha/beta hydrolase [Pseudohaliea rubra]KGE02894.1 alpha/beta hydrolase fold protein [Pseudohaliea rubra DSM 19751]